tara:strand:+ start:348 stop:473 length:126 start_codon:yes stop_codon:yes gene_type:complete
METLWWWIVLIGTIFLALCIPGLIAEFIKQIKEDFFDKENK